jgi:hypothetical protein
MGMVVLIAALVMTAHPTAAIGKPVKLSRSAQTCNSMLHMQVAALKVLSGGTRVNEHFFPHHMVFLHVQSLQFTCEAELSLVNLLLPFEPH